jgi:isoaspartyl peptidase/L-asparaginase-like protein (Ntn-hydrolase superfamily)
MFLDGSGIHPLSVLEHIVRNMAVGGISCTGVGEKIMVICLSKEISNYLQYNSGKKAMDAAQFGISLLDSISG